MDMSTTHPDLRRPHDLKAEYEAAQEMGENGSTADFTATFERAINPAGVQVRRVVLTGPWRVDPDRVEK